MRLLLVEDDKALAGALAYRFKKEGMETIVCYDGVEAISAIADSAPDIAILDRMLPGADGVTVLRYMRDKGLDTPVLMLTAMDGIHDRVTGLDAGADDYLVKPFSMDELMARVRALSRRKAPWQAKEALRAGDLSLDAERLALSCRGAALALSKRECALLSYLMLNQRQILPRGIIIDRVWEMANVEDGTLDIYIHFLRKHLKALRSRVRIDTVRGVGYCLATGE